MEASESFEREGGQGKCFVCNSFNCMASIKVFDTTSQIFFFILLPTRVFCRLVHFIFFGG